MLDSGDLELAVGYLKSIVESCRCPICDSGTGGRLRYNCEHVACPDCAEVAPACQLCTPPRGSGELVHDERLTRRVLHVGELVRSFREAYNIDVLKSKRISDQQKAERSLFPHCIQAPQTYSNKKKSFITPKKSKGKENISTLPGELITEVAIMNNSENYVQKWLDQHDDDFKKYQPRQPFADLSINSPKVNTPAKKSLSLKKSQTPSKSAKKRPFVTALSGNSKSQSILDKYEKEINKSNISERAKRIKKELAKLQVEDKPVQSVKNVKKHEKDESGIELDDEAIVIDDSQDVAFIDKDKAAWLAILEADQIECTPNSNIKTVEAEETKQQVEQPEPHPIFSPINVLNWMSSDTDKTSVGKKPHKVPFYKKASLTKNTLRHNTQQNNNTAAPAEDKNTSIIVETSNVITKITVKKAITNTPKYIKLCSQAIQTDLSKENTLSKQTTTKLLESEDMFTIENKDLPKICESTESAETIKLTPKVKKNLTCAKNTKSTDKESLTIIDSKSNEPKVNTDFAAEQTITAVNIKDLEKQKAVLLLASSSRSDLTITNKDKSSNKRVILLDSSSDSEHDMSGKFTVTSDVHSSHEDWDIQGVLREINLTDIQVPKAVKRGPTPTSTDSSDKENREPNTKRRRRDGKKSRKKHKL